MLLNTTQTTKRNIQLSLIKFFRFGNLLYIKISILMSISTKKEETDYNGKK